MIFIENALWFLGYQLDFRCLDDNAKKDILTDRDFDYIDMKH